MIKIHLWGIKENEQNDDIDMLYVIVYYRGKRWRRDCPSNQLDSYFLKSDVVCTF